MLIILFIINISMRKKLFIMEKSVGLCMNFLNAQSIKVQREWCEACLEWIMEENNVSFSSQLCIVKEELQK